MPAGDHSVIVQQLVAFFVSGRRQKVVAAQRRHSIDRDFRTVRVRRIDVELAIRELKAELVHAIRIEKVSISKESRIILNLPAGSPGRSAQAAKVSTNRVNIRERQTAEHLAGFGNGMIQSE